MTVKPSARGWAELLEIRPELSAKARRFREQLGLPTDRGVVLSGHQAQIWHPGILAKLLAIQAAAQLWGLYAAWVVVDQDDHDPWAIRYPVRRADGRLETRLWRMAGEEPAQPAHIPTRNLPSARAPVVPKLAAGESFVAPGIESGLNRIAVAIGGSDHEPSAAAQIAAATTALFSPLAGRIQTVFATTIARTDLFAEIVARMRQDPSWVIRSYNGAVRANPGAQIAELRVSEGELPLWQIPPRAGAPRRRVLASMLDSVPVVDLAPRALLMTGMLRWAGCDLFVHGTGGAGHDGRTGYDAITAHWFRDWLAAAFFPAPIVTATVRLNIQASDPPITPEQIARARWLAHAARHRPSLLRDAEGEQQRGAALATLKRLRWKRDPASKRVKLETYRSLQRTLESVRARRAADLDRLTAEAAQAAARRKEAEIIADRTWAFPLYEEAQLRNLADTIGGQFR